MESWLSFLRGGGDFVCTTIYKSTFSQPPLENRVHFLWFFVEFIQKRFKIFICCLSPTCQKYPSEISDFALTNPPPPFWESFPILQGLGVAQAAVTECWP